MDCVFGPYQITSPNFSDGKFVDEQKFRRVAKITPCGEVASPPCGNATIVHSEVLCPDNDCNITWYECQDKGRTYTILVTPCEVLITSFEDGLLFSGGCDASQHGVGHFCFGTTYVDEKQIESKNNAVTFEFDGHTFTVSGNVGVCDDIFDCKECYHEGLSIESFGDVLPTAPELATSPSDEDADTVIDIVTQEINSEGRTVWHNLPTAEAGPVGQSTVCDTERNVTEWVSTAPSLGSCDSNDNPSIATLPSGHTVIAYENRDEAGNVSIALVVLATSVKDTVKYNRKLSRGTLINNASSLENKGTFEIFDDIFIDVGQNGVPSASLKLGFLSGPFVGALLTIDKIERFETSSSVKRVFTFSIASPIDFPDSNNIYDIEWFLVEDGNEDLPDSDNIATILAMPPHLFKGKLVPTVNPVVVVARNNLMVVFEQNIYVAYQAYEENQWRVYLRQIVLSDDLLDLSPVYLTPYLFATPARQIELMSAFPATIELFSGENVTIFDDNFTYGLTENIDLSDAVNASQWIQLPEGLTWTGEDFFNSTLNTGTYTYTEVVECKNILWPPLLSAQACSPNSGTNCLAVWNAHVVVLNDDNPPIPVTRVPCDFDMETQVFVGPRDDFEGSNSRTYVSSGVGSFKAGTSLPAPNVTFSIKFGFHRASITQLENGQVTGLNSLVGNTFEVYLQEWPEIWILLGRPDANSGWEEGWRIQITRAGSSGRAAGGEFIGCSDCTVFRGRGCFRFRLYNGFGKRPDEVTEDRWDSPRDAHTGNAQDLWVREIKRCIDSKERDGNYDPERWNQWRVNTFIKGRHRVFELFLSHPDSVISDTTEILMASFREFDDAVNPLSVPRKPTLPSSYETAIDADVFGAYHGFALWSAFRPLRITVDNATLICNPDPIVPFTFYEDWMDSDGRKSSQIPPRTTISPNRPQLDPNPGTRYFNNIESQPNVWTNYNYGRLVMCADASESWYRGVTTEPETRGALLITPFLPTSDDSCDLTTADVGTGIWTILQLLVNSRHRVFTGIDVVDTALVIAVHRSIQRDHSGAYPHIWFLLRQGPPSDATVVPKITWNWYDGWRIRIRRHNDSQTSINQWELNLYDSATGDTGDSDDVAVDTVTLDVVTGTPGAGETNIDWTDRTSSDGFDDNTHFKVETYEIDTTTTRFDISVAFGTKRTQVIKVGAHGARSDDITDTDLTYELLHRFTRNTSTNARHLGLHYGFAFFSGAASDPLFSAPARTAWRVLFNIEYIALESRDTLVSGACCDASTGNCTGNQTAGQCTANNPDNTFTAGAQCSSVDCNPIGASCRVIDGECAVSTEAAVPEGFVDWESGKNCNSASGAFRDCPPPPGACCLPDGTCVQLGEVECASRHTPGTTGKWFANTACGAIPSCVAVVIPVGACCIADAINGGQLCRVTDATDCASLSGSYQGNDTNCNSNCLRGACTQPTGGCCTGGSCVEAQSQCSCETGGGDFLGDGSDCSTNPCLLGACCDADGGCTITNEAFCDIGYGTFNLAASCSDIPDPCVQPIGACCNLITGVCTSVAEEDCAGNNQLFKGAGVSCSPGLCPQPDGACCIGGVCSRQLEVVCIASGGLYFGDHSSCLPRQCEREDPYADTTITYKPEDLWKIEIGDKQFVTRVLYHMKENITENIGSGGDVDIVIAVDHSDKNAFVSKVQAAIPNLADALVGRGVDAQFGLIVFARDDAEDQGLIEPDRWAGCPVGSENKVFNGLQASVACSPGGVSGGIPEISGGFTANINEMQDALGCWGTTIEGLIDPWLVMKFAATSSEFEWRDNSRRFLIYVSDSGVISETNESLDCTSEVPPQSFSPNTKESAVQSLIDNNVIFIPIICRSSDDGCNPGSSPLPFDDIGSQTGWNGPIFNVTGDYDNIFEIIVEEIQASVRLLDARIVERDISGTDATFIKNAEIIITYDGDLTDLWTFNKSDFEFDSLHVPFPGTATKELSGFPFALAGGKIYGVDAVHIQGNPNNWVSFGKSGPIKTDSSSATAVGFRASSVSSPALIGLNATRPKLFVNNKNQVILAYESYESGTAQIEIKGTGDFHQDSIVGAKASRITKFITPSDFAFSHAITVFGEGINQLCDFVIDNNDITHTVWQSNRDGRWEIYYANSSDLFSPVRITDIDSISSFPSIDLDVSGNIFVVYHDNRFGPFEIMMATKEEERVLPFLEQDAYLASLRNSYTHNTNLIPVFIDNPDGPAAFFHIIIEFYDNINLEGEPFITVDSRENLEAFINQEVEQGDPYDPYTISGADSRGVHVGIGKTAVIFFDATHEVIGFSNLAQPYGFEPNQTYFPKVFSISPTGDLRQSGVEQKNSFSCTKCSRLGNNNFNTSGCSYSFAIQNGDVAEKDFNFQVEFYADAAKQHILRRFELSPDNSDLQFVEVDNKPATEKWGSSGLSLKSEESAFIQIYPAIDPQAGFLCGIKYHVQVNQCTGSDCSLFEPTLIKSWSSLPIDGLAIAIDLTSPKGTDQLTYGLSMTTAPNGEIAIAWRDGSNNLLYSTSSDNISWKTQVVDSDGDVSYCSIDVIDGKITIAYVKNLIPVNETQRLIKAVVFNGSNFDEFPLRGSSRNIELGPPSVIENTDFGTINVGDVSSLPLGLRFRNSVEADSVAFDIDFGSLMDTEVISGVPTVVYSIGGIIKTSRYENKRFGAADPPIQKDWTFRENNDQFEGEPPGTIDDGTSGLATDGKPAVIEVQGQPAVAYVRQIGGDRKVVYRRYTGSVWQEFDTKSGQKNINKNVAMTLVGGQPAIAYSVETSPGISELRFTQLHETTFIDELIDDNIVTPSEPLVDITTLEGSPVVTISANPFKIYFVKEKPGTVPTEISPFFLCDCSSKIFPNRQTPLSAVGRWESSAHGFADTRITDSPKDSLRPVIKTRTTGNSVILWEDHNFDPSHLRAATFRLSNQDQLRSSGTGSWFDYEFGSDKGKREGQDVDMTLDLFDRVVTTYEKPQLVDSVTGFFGKGLSKNELPGNAVFSKVCDFQEEGEIIEASIEDCDISSLEANVISFDEFLTNKIVKRIRVKDEFVEYYTYNAVGKLTSIVSTCNIALEIHGVPEIVALRLRNENSSFFTAWCPWSPQLGDFMMEIDHKLSPGSGIKEVCIQFMTYSGVTTEVCLPIIGDYEQLVFETRFYKETADITATSFLSISSGVFTVSDLELLPEFEGIAVAALPEIDKNIRTILVEIIPNKDISEEILNFDVLRQGTNDTAGLPSIKGKNKDGRVVFRGHFDIEKEDKGENVDGLARVRPIFLSDCEVTSTVASASAFDKDPHNLIEKPPEVEIVAGEDPLSDFRQETSGRVGVTLDIRGTEDPYFVFGDPNYSLRKRDGQRLGVPFKSTSSGVSIGDAPDVVICQSNDDCAENEECVDGECTPKESSDG